MAGHRVTLAHFRQGNRNRMLATPFRSLRKTIAHGASTAAAAKLEKNPPSLPFDSIPGPKGLPVVGSLPEVIRNLGKGHELITRRFQEYGPIFKEKAGSMVLVNTCDLEAIERLCRHEGKYPKRIVIPPWNQWREDRNLAKGVLTGDGPDWKRMRKILNQRMLRPLHVATYTDRFNEVVTDFVARLRHVRETKGAGVSVPNLDMELFHWSLETIGTVLYERRFGGLEDTRDPEIEKFIRAVHGVFKSTEKVIYFPKWLGKLLIPKYQNMHDESWQIVFDTSSRLIEEKVREIGHHLEQGQEVESFLSHLLASDQLSREELVANISEVMLGAVDTTSNTMQWILYQLSQNPEVQERLHNEVMAVTDNGSRIPGNKDLQDMPYLKGVIKETLRLYPVAGVVARDVPEDLVLCGYLIPKGTTVLGSVYYTGRDPANFRDPERFLPERWLRDEAYHMNTFAWLPFGFGPRMCIGRRVAELEMQLLIVRLSQQFRVEPLNDKPLRICTRSLIVPERSVEIKLIDRG